MKDIISYLKIFYQATYLPLYYYENNHLVFQVPETNGYCFLDCFLHTFAQSENMVDLFITKSGLFWGIIRNFATDEYIIAGPVCTIPPNRDMIFEIMSEYSISTKHKTDVEYFFSISPTFSHHQFVHLLSVLNVYINDTLLDPEHFFTSESVYSLDTINEKLSSGLYQVKEVENFHNSFQFEQKMCHYVQEGNVESLKALLQKSYSIQTGIMGETPIRQEKNKFIAIITLLTRHSIYGGLDVETAYQLSDAYIMESEKAPSIDTIGRLIYTAILDFAKRVAENKIPAGMSSDVFKSIQFVSTHTNQPISVKDVADAIGKSTSLISKKFKKELGFNLCDFITSRKLEEGKSLLLYSEKSISDISEYLCFSSQSYFQNIFKKKYGMTPYNYRKEHRRQ